MTSRQAAISKAKDDFWLLSRRGINPDQRLLSVEGGWQWQGESFDAVEWKVTLKTNGALAKAVRV